MIEVPLASKVAFLRRPDIYPGIVSQVDAVETHMSWVFFAADSAYKLKKPITFDRLDFSTLALRRFYCEEEVRLNRRLAGDVYRGTVALTREADGALALGGRGEPVDWLVHMQKLPADGMLDAILAKRTVQKEDVAPVALRLAEFFRAARRIPISTTELCRRLEEGIRDDRAELLRPEFGLDRQRVEAVAQGQLAFLDRHTALFDERIREERIVEGHGDLRPEHVCLEPVPVIIDCLEFCEELREVDPADELAFLALECERLGQPQVGLWFLEAYQDRTKDLVPPAILEFYRSHRILRRAKIAIWHLREPDSPRRQRYADRARRYLEIARPWVG